MQVGVPELVDRANRPQQAEAVGVIQKWHQVPWEPSFPGEAQGGYVAEQPRVVTRDRESCHQPAYPDGKPGSAPGGEPEQQPSLPRFPR